MRIFISGPLSAALPATRMMNVHRALAAGAALIAKGHAPFVPHCAHYVDTVARTHGLAIEYEAWMTWCFTWLDTCQALLCLGPSPGADRERERAIELGLPVYERVEDVPEAGDETAANGAA